MVCAHASIREIRGHLERVRRVVSCAQDADLLLAKRLQEQEHAFAMLAGCASALTVVCPTHSLSGLLHRVQAAQLAISMCVASKRLQGQEPTLLRLPGACQTGGDLPCAWCVSGSSG